MFLSEINPHQGVSRRGGDLCVCSCGGFATEVLNCTHAHHKSEAWEPQQGLLQVPVTSGVLGSGFKLPYLWGHSANGGQVITSAQEVRSVDLQLKAAQPLDNSL